MSLPEGSRKKLLAVGGAAALLIAVVAAVLWHFVAGLSESQGLAGSADAADRIKAAERLDGKDGEAAQRLLRGLANDRDQTVARRAVRSITSRRLLEDIARDTKLGGAARGEAAAALGKFADTDPTILTGLLTADPNAQARAGAAMGLARLRNVKTLPSLSQALEDGDPEVRLWAVTAIHKMILRRFPYDAKLPPAQQREVIQRIRDYLRTCGML